MSLNIKNEETHRLVRELTHLTGENQATAVTQAVRERIRRVRCERAERPHLAERLLAIGADCAPRLREPYRSVAHGDLLYGEDGLPE